MIVLILEILKFAPQLFDLSGLAFYNLPTVVYNLLQPSILPPEPFVLSIFPQKVTMQILELHLVTVQGV